MSTPMNHEELVELILYVKFGYLRFVVEGETGQEFLSGCGAPATDPSDESAEFYVEQTDIMQMERQLIDDDDYGIWN